MDREGVCAPLIFHSNHRLPHMTKTIYTRKGEAILVDDEDYDELRKHTWCVNGKGYAIRKKQVKGKQQIIYMHRVVVLCQLTEDRKEVDHINRNRLDNRRCNLRAVTSQENKWNQSKARHNTSGYTGVSFYKNNRFKQWRASIKVNKKTVTIGYYFTPELAYEAYLNAKAEYHRIELD